MTEAEKRRELRDLLATIYTPEGVLIWIRAAEAKGWSLDEQLQRAAQLADGAYA